MIFKKKKLTEKEATRFLLNDFLERSGKVIPGNNFEEEKVLAFELPWREVYNKRNKIEETGNYPWVLTDNALYGYTMYRISYKDFSLKKDHLKLYLKSLNKDIDRFQIQRLPSQYVHNYNTRCFCNYCIKNGLATEKKLDSDSYFNLDVTSKREFVMKVINTFNWVD